MLNTSHGFATGFSGFGTCKMNNYYFYCVHLHANSNERFSSPYTIMCLIYRRTPFVVAIALYLLWQEIGVAAIFGIAYMFLVLPLCVTAIARKYSKNDVSACTSAVHVVGAPNGYEKIMYMYIHACVSLLEYFIMRVPSVISPDLFRWNEQEWMMKD